MPPFLCCSSRCPKDINLTPDPMQFINMSSQHGHLVSVLQLTAELCLPALSLLHILTSSCQLSLQPLAHLPLRIQLALQPCRIFLHA